MVQARDRATVRALQTRYRAKAWAVQKSGTGTSAQSAGLPPGTICRDRAAQHHDLLFTLPAGEGATVPARARTLFGLSGGVPQGRAR